MPSDAIVVDNATATCVYKGMAKDIGKRIRKVRELIGEAQWRFAKRIGVSQTCLYRWEAGQIIPKGPALRVVEEVLAELEATDA